MKQILITKSKDGWPVIEKGEIYEYVRIRKKEKIYVGIQEGVFFEKHIPMEYAEIIINNVEQLKLF